MLIELHETTRCFDPCISSWLFIMVAGKGQGGVRVGVIRVIRVRVMVMADNTR